MNDTPFKSGAADQHVRRAILMSSAAIVFRCNIVSVGIMDVPTKRAPSFGRGIHVDRRRCIERLLFVQVHHGYKIGQS